MRRDRSTKLICPPNMPAKKDLIFFQSSIFKALFSEVFFGVIVKKTRVGAQCHAAFHAFHAGSPARHYQPANVLVYCKPV